MKFCFMEEYEFFVQTYLLTVSLQNLNFMKKVILFFLLAFQLNSSIAQEWCDSTLVACDSVFLDSIWITHHPQNGDRLQVRIRTEHDFLHGPTFIICPTEDSIQFLNNSFPFFGIVGPTFAQFYYQFEEFNFTDETITGDIILNHAAPPPAFSTCVLSFSIDVTDSTTAVNDIFFKNELTVFPNPTNDVLNIKIENEENKITGIKLSDLSGKLQQINTKEHSIDVSELPPGLYILEVDFDNKKSVTKKIIIQ